MEVTRLGSNQSCICDLHHGSWQCQILNPLSETRDQTCNLMDTSWIRFSWATMGTPAVRVLTHCTTLGTPSSLFFFFIFVLFLSFFFFFFFFGSLCCCCSLAINLHLSLLECGSRSTSPPPYVRPHPQFGNAKSSENSDFQGSFGSKSCSDQKGGYCESLSTQREAL